MLRRVTRDADKGLLGIAMDTLQKNGVAAVIPEKELALQKIMCAWYLLPQLFDTKADARGFANCPDAPYTDETREWPSFCIA